MKNLLIVAIIIAVIGGAMYVYLEHEPVSDDLLTGTTMGGISTGVAGDQLSVLKTLQNLVIDTSLFEKKVWKSFYDSGHEIKEQPVSRPNPFAPINPSETTFAPTVTTATTTTP